MQIGIKQIPQNFKDLSPWWYIKGLVTWVKLRYSSKVEDYVLTTISKEEKCLVGLFRFWRWHIPHLAIHSDPLTNSKTCQFWMGAWTREEYVIYPDCYAILSVTWTAWTKDPMMLEVYVADYEEVIRCSYRWIIAMNLKTF